MEFVISMVGADRVMIGSDYGFDMGYEQPVGFVKELNLSPDARQMIRGRTAAKVLKLTLAAENLAGVNACERPART